MIKYLYLLFFTLFTFTLSARLENRASYPSNPNWNLNIDHYPTIRKEDKSFKYPSKKHPKGVLVPDPFNWMESSLDKSKELQEFVKEETELTKSYLAKCSSNKQKIKEEIQKSLDLPWFTSLTQFGTIEKPIFLYSYTDQKLNLPQWYLATQNELDQAKRENFQNPTGKMILDCSTLSKDGSANAGSWDIKNDQTLAAFSVIGLSSGSEIHFIDLINPKKKHEILYNAGLQNFVFTPDGKSIIYDLQDKDFGGNSRLVMHTLGTDQKNDVILVQPYKDNSYLNNWNVIISNDEKWMIVTGAGSTTASILYIASLEQPLNDPSKIKWISIVPEDEGYIQYFHNIDNKFFFLTTIGNAANNKVVTTQIDPSKAKTTSNLLNLKDKANLQDLIPERKDAYLDYWMILGGKTAVLTYTELQGSTFFVYDLKKGKQVKQILQDLITSKVVYTNYYFQSNDAYMDTSSFAYGTRCYHLHLDANGEVTTNVALQGNPRGIDMSQYKVEQTLVKSKDGTMIPFVMMHKKDYQYDGKGSAWLHFYSAFGVSIYQQYDPLLLSWINNFGGVFAYIFARGGGEFGENWHQSATGFNRDRTFEDIEAVMQYMVDQKIVSSSKIILDADGPGGQEAMVVANRAQEGLIGAIVSKNGIFDILRSGNYSFPISTFSDDWGNPNTPEGFDAIYPYSPLNHVDPTKVYPSIMLSTTNSKDDQKIKSQVFKMIAQLQITHPKNTNPLLLDVRQEGEPIISQIPDANVRLAIDQQCFVSESLNLKLIQ